MRIQLKHVQLVHVIIPLGPDSLKYRGDTRRPNIRNVNGGIVPADHLAIYPNKLRIFRHP